MAPEQVSSGNVTRRADIYSAGVVAWEMLAGLRLFRAENRGAILLDIVQGKVEPLRNYAPDVPEALEAAVMKALSRDASGRFETAEEFATALEEAVAPSPARQVGRWVAEIAKNTLDARKDLISRIEERSSLAEPSSSSAAPVVMNPPLLPPSASSGVSDAGSSGAGGTAIGSTISTSSEGFERRRKRIPVWSILLGLGLLVGTIGVFAVVKRGTNDADPAAAPAPTDPRSTTDKPAGVAIPTTTVEPISESEARSSSSAAASASARASATAPAQAKATASAAAAAVPPKPKPGGVSCNPNYFIDAKGVKRYKKECLQ
jgi:serine/threonine-protein kinase